MRAGDHDLQHVHPEHDEHCVPAEMMQPADQPAEVHLILDVVDAAPRRAFAGAVVEHQEDAGDDLDREYEGEGAAPDVAPLGAAGNVFQEQGVANLAKARATVEPVREFSRHVLTSTGLRCAGSSLFSTADSSRTRQEADPGCWDRDSWDRRPARTQAYPCRD